MSSDTFQMPHDVREPADFEAGVYFLGDRGAADDMAPLENQSPQAGPGEIGPAGEPVVATADNDGVIRSLHQTTNNGCRTARPLSS